jgi:predicted nucleic acid-binding protein
MRRQKDKSILVDTNTILRYLLKDVPDLYEKAETLFKRVRTGEQKIEVTEGVLAEAVYVLLKYYRVPKQEVVETLGAFLLYKGNAGRSRSEYLQALRFFGQTGLDFVDCLLAARAKARKVDLFAFDKELLKAIGE